MVGLLDIAPSTRTVPVEGQNVSVFGVSAKGIAALLSQFPNLKNAFVGGKVSFDVDSLVASAPDAISAIIAAGCGYPGDAAAVDRASQLPAGSQLALLKAIVELTMPDGIDPFVEALNGMLDKMDGLNIADRGKAPDTKLASPSKA